MKSPFRSIRHTLFNEGKLVRYLGYAIGEVVLIIVGIMIALQLNNWNEDRKAKAEFDLYIVQLKEDVREAADRISNANSVLEEFKERCEFVLTFLELPNYETEELDSFESGLNALGNYAEVQVHVGLLGEVLSGDADILRLDPNLVRKTLEMESDIEFRLNSASHVYNQIDLATDRLNQFRGKGTDLGQQPRYDLEKLKASDEFANTAQTIVSRLHRLITNNRSIRKILNDFLTVLEEYE